MTSATSSLTRPASASTLSAASAIPLTARPDDAAPVIPHPRGPRPPPPPPPPRAGFPKNPARGAVLPVHEARDQFDADDEDPLGGNLNPSAGDVEGEHEAGTTAAPEVVGGHLPGPEPMLQVGGGVRGVHLGGGGGHDDLVDVAVCETGTTQ